MDYKNIKVNQYINNINKEQKKILVLRNNKEILRLKYLRNRMRH